MAFSDFRSSLKLGRRRRRRSRLRCIVLKPLARRGQQRIERDGFVVGAGYRAEDGLLRRAVLFRSARQHGAQPVIAHLARLRRQSGEALNAIVGTDLRRIARGKLSVPRPLQDALLLACGDNRVEILQVLLVFGNSHVAPTVIGRRLLRARGDWPGSE